MPIETMHICDFCGDRQPYYATHMNQVSLDTFSLDTGDQDRFDIGLMCQRCTKVLRAAIDKKLAELSKIKAGEK